MQLLHAAAVQWNETCTMVIATRKAIGTLVKSRGGKMFGHARWLCLSLLTVLAALCLCGQKASAQTLDDDVHIQPRTQSKGQAVSLDSSTNTHAALIHKNVDLVLVPVTVTDASNRLITGLDQSNFQLYEGKQAQNIRHFSSEDVPVSIGIVLDVSGSMVSKIERARESVIQLLKESNPEDEFFLLTFADTLNLVQDFTQNVDELQNRLLFTTPQGRTSLIDAIFLAVERMKKAKNSRKALVIISDGGDNRSRYTENDLKSLVKEADVLVYSIGVFDQEFRSQEERLGPELLSDISAVTGASSFTLDNSNDLPGITSRIALELRNQYLLGYQPETLQRDGKWRKIKVKLSLPRGISALRVQARTGYYAPSQ